MKFVTNLVEDCYSITMDSPSNLNAQSPKMWEQLTQIFQAVPSEARFIVLRGNGKAFSAGLDRKMFTPEGIDGQPSFLELASRPENEIDGIIAHYQEAFRALRDLPQLSFALVQGYAIGAGFQLALACDMIITQPDAQFALKETSLGLIPDLGGSGHIFRLMGYARALEFCATGRFMSGDEAYSLGVAIASSPNLESTLASVLEPMRAALPNALMETKRVLRNIAYGEEPWLAERRAQTRRLQDLKALFLQSQES